MNQISITLGIQFMSMWPKLNSFRNKGMWGKSGKIEGRGIKLPLTYRTISRL